METHTHTHTHTNSENECTHKQSKHNFNLEITQTHVEINTDVHTPVSWFTEQVARGRSAPSCSDRIGDDANSPLTTQQDSVCKLTSRKVWGFCAAPSYPRLHLYKETRGDSNRTGQWQCPRWLHVFSSYYKQQLFKQKPLEHNKIRLQWDFNMEMKHSGALWDNNSRKNNNPVILFNCIMSLCIFFCANKICLLLN